MIFDKQSLSCQIQGLAKIYDRYFHGLTNGTFVEVGGNDGYSWSNTWGLAEIGWRGLCLEPMPELAAKCKEQHKNNNVQVLGKAVGEFFGHCKLYLGESATTSAFVAKDNTFFYGNSPANFVECPVVSLNSILPVFEIPHDFELLVIDVDGDECGVIEGIDLNVWRPIMIIVETSAEHPIEAWRFNAVRIDFLLSQCYDEVYRDHINSIYIRKAVKTLTTLFESKRDTLLNYAGWYGLETFVETGTCQGDTLACLYPYFKRAHSIELSSDFYRFSAARFKRASNVKIWQGDSGEVLKGIMPLLTEPALFFLDAHYSGGYTAQGIDETPILRELKAILSAGKFNGVILIDDLKDFIENPSYPKPAAVQEWITKNYPTLSCVIIPDGGGMIMIVPTKKKLDKSRKAVQLVPVVIEESEKCAVCDPECPCKAENKPDDKYRWVRAPILYGPYRNPPKEN
jgi:FkbM family methyltransferase